MEWHNDGDKFQDSTVIYSLEFKWCNSYWNVLNYVPCFQLDCLKTTIQFTKCRLLKTEQHDRHSDLTKTRLLYRVSRTCTLA